jgi:hypothetical protein
VVHQQEDAIEAGRLQRQHLALQQGHAQDIDQGLGKAVQP